MNTTPPRVAYVLLWYPKPSETFVFNEVLGLGEAGIPVEVFTLYGELTRHLSAEMRANSAAVHRLGAPGIPRLCGAVAYWWRRDRETTGRLLRTVPWRRWGDIETTVENHWAFWGGFWLARRVAQQRIEHVHAPWAGGPATAAWVASRLARVPFSFAVHAHDICPPDAAFALKAAAASFIRSENRVNLRQIGPFAQSVEAKSHVIHNGQRLRAPPPAPVAMTPPGRIAAMGRFVPKKGFDVLLAAVRKLHDRGEHVRLTLAGSGWRRPRLKAAARRLGLRDAVSFPGFVPYERVPDVLAAADVFVMPSVVDRSGDRDGIPNVVLEAMLCRIPVVATDVGGISEVVLDGDTGILVPPGDPTALADGVQRVFADRANAIAMAERGRDRVARDFDLQTSCARMAELFRRHRAAPTDANDAAG
jgi:glycosyltransferase involved in cell wall biosynthesis